MLSTWLSPYYQQSIDDDDSTLTRSSKLALCKSCNNNNNDDMQWFNVLTRSQLSPAQRLNINWVILTCALWELIVAISTLVTVESVVVWFARTLSTTDLTHLTLGTIDMTLTWNTARIAVVSHVAPDNIAIYLSSSSSSSSSYSGQSINQSIHQSIYIVP